MFFQLISRIAIDLTDMQELIRKQDIKNHKHRKPKQHPDKLEKGAKMHWHEIKKSDQNLEKWSRLNIIDLPSK